MVHSRPRRDRVFNRLMLGDVEVLDEEKEEDQEGELEEEAREGSAQALRYRDEPPRDTRYHKTRCEVAR